MGHFSIFDRGLSSALACGSVLDYITQVGTSPQLVPGRCNA
jgi:hypothetical protein